MNDFRSIPRSALRAMTFYTRFALLAAQNAAIGGQAVMEGVMMRSPNHWAIAIRRRNGEIVEIHRPHVGYAARHAWARLPLIRGVIALGESLSIGFRALSVSAHYAAEWEDEEETTDDATAAMESSGAAKVVPISESVDVPSHVADETDEVDSDANPDTLKTWQIAIAFIVAIGFTILLFKVTPVLLTQMFGVPSRAGAFVLVESTLRIGIFIGYLALVGFMPDMKRVFQYHSAEHKSINAWEHGIELEPELVNEQSRIHVRCGTAFMLWVFVVAIAVFATFGYLFHPNLIGIIVSRVLLLPVIAGISFELIRFAGKHPDNRVLRAIMAPGLWLQYLTTRPCAPDQCEVAVRSLQVVLRNEYPDYNEQEALDALTGDDDAALQVLA